MWLCVSVSFVYYVKCDKKCPQLFSLHSLQSGFLASPMKRQSASPPLPQDCAGEKMRESSSQPVLSKPDPQEA